MESLEVKPAHSVDTHGHDHHDDHEHHEGTFLTKYIFSEDHKVIAKQFLISGMFWGVMLS